MKFSICTLFPDFFTSPLQSSIVKRSQEKNIIEVETVDIRKFCTDKHRQADDSPYGGGKGMLMKAEPVAKAIESLKSQNPNAEVIFFTPSGSPLTQQKSYEYANNGKDKILLCGHYEGIDHRVIESHVDSCVSIGETVVTGGEIPALFFLDSVARLIPGVISKEESHERETFSQELYGKGEYPQFTRPEIWREKQVPAVLLSGNHKNIEQYQRENIQCCSDQEKLMIHVRNTFFRPEKPYKTRNFHLRTSILEDITQWHKWFNDIEIYLYTRSNGFVTMEDEEYYFQWQHTNLSMLKLEIIDKKTKDHIGTASWIIHEQNNSAQYGLVIGDKTRWNTGVATEVTRSMIEIARDILHVQKVFLDVFTENIAAQKVYEKCGFQKMGTEQRHCYKNDTWHDAFLYELLFEV